MSVDYFKVCKNVGTLQQNGTGFSLNTEVTGFMKKMIELDTLVSFLNDCGIEIDIDKIAADGNVKNAFWYYESKREIKIYI